MSLHFFILYVDPMPMVFNICPLTWAEWVVVMKISLPVLVADEVMKYIAREYVEKDDSLADSLYYCVLFSTFFKYIFNTTLFHTHIQTNTYYQEHF